eukprot:5089960-Pleurochrysis_carterae.AAC.1
MPTKMPAWSSPKHSGGRKSMENHAMSPSSSASTAVAAVATWVARVATGDRRDANAPRTQPRSVVLGGLG